MAMAMGSCGRLTSSICKPSTLISARSYATRRPERPPQKIRDPLLADPTASIQELPNKLTFIHRPPPSAPAPQSTTLAPTSPLLARRQNISSLSTLTNPSTPTEVNDPALPPPIRQPTSHPTARTLSKADFEEMKRLRASDPKKYSRNVLAKMFSCPRFLVGQQAGLARDTKVDKVQDVVEEHALIRGKWGERKALVMAIRRKRRSLW